MKTTPLPQLVRAAIEEIKGLDVKFIDVRELTTITDYMAVCTGTSNRHVKSIADNVVAKAKEGGYRPLGVEGLEAGEWVLVDLADVVVHVMQAQARAFYQLEKLWDVAPEPVEAAKPARKPRRPNGPPAAGRGPKPGKGKDRRRPASRGRKPRK